MDKDIKAIQIKKAFRLRQIKKAFTYAMGQYIFNDYNHLPYQERQIRFDFTGNWKHKNTRLKKNGNEVYTFENKSLINCKNLCLTVENYTGMQIVEEINQ